MFRSYITILLLISGRVFEAKIFERCEFVHTLIETHFFHTDDLPAWTCIATWASAFNSSKESNLFNGKRRYGIMQIDDYHGCGEGEFSWCDLSCEEFLDEQLRNDLRCTVVLSYFIGQDGFEGWPEWEKHCKGQDLSPYVEGCFENALPTSEPWQHEILKPAE